MPEITAVTHAGIVVPCFHPPAGDASEALGSRTLSPQGIQELFTYVSAMG